MKTKMEHFPAKNQNPVLCVEKDGTVLYSNEAGESLLHEWGVGIGEKLPSCIRDFVQRVISRNSPEKIEVKVGKRVYLIAFHPLPEEECVNIYGFDISDQKELEGKLRESEEKYRRLFNSIEEGFCVIEKVEDKEGQPLDFRFLEANPAFATQSGVSGVVGKTIRQVFPEETEEWIDIYGTILRTGESIRFERNFASQGRVLELYAFRIEDETHRRVAVIFRDINERKQTEEALHQATERERFLADVVEKADVSVGVGAPDGRLLMFNRAFLDLTGYSCGELIQKQLTWSTDLTPPEWREDEAAHLAEAIRTRQPVRYEKECLRKDGTRVPIELLVQPVFDTSGKLLHYRSFLTDITERKRTEEALRKSEERFRALVTTSSEVVYRMSPNWSEMNRLCGRGFLADTERPSLAWLQEYIHPDDHPHVNAVINEAIRTKSIFELEHRVRRADGSIGWTYSRAVPIMDANREIVEWFGAASDITERKHAEEEREQLLGAIQQEKDRLAALINSITDEVWFADTQKNFTLVNPSGLREFSICAEEKIEVEKLATSLEVYRPDGSTRPVEEAPPLRALRGEVVKNQEEIIPTPVHGELRYRLVSAAPVHDIGGNIIGSVSVVRDITESKKAEEEIQNLANIVESSNDAIITKSFGGIITSWNKGAEQIYGYSAREVLGKPISIIEPDSLKGEIEQLGEMIKQGDKIHNYETLRLRKDGTIIDVSITLSPVFDVSGELVAISAIARDITESRRAEEKLRESEEKYRNIVETANEGILIIDDKAIVTYANQKLADMLGYTLEEGVGRPIWDFISEESKAIAKLNLEKRLHGINESYELKLICKDGSPLWALINAKSLFDKNGKFMGSISMLTDITERKEAEDALANIEIARKKEIHHRIKNNLQVISSLLDLQAEKFNNRENIKDSEVLEAFRESQDRVISMALIHEELYKSGGIDTLDFSSYIQELTESLFLTYRFGNININLNMDLEENLFFDMDTAIPLGMIVNELVSNSLKHAFIGRDKGEIRIKLCREKTEECINNIEKSKNEGCKSTSFTLIVSDNGVGIPENLDIEDQDTLGFQLVASLVDQLDGEFELKRNNGADFTMRFTVTEK